MPFPPLFVGFDYASNVSKSSFTTVHLMQEQVVSLIEHVYVFIPLSSKLIKKLFHNSFIWSSNQLFRELTE